MSGPTTDRPLVPIGNEHTDLFREIGNDELPKLLSRDAELVKHAESFLATGDAMAHRALSDASYLVPMFEKAVVMSILSRPGTSAVSVWSESLTLPKAAKGE